MRGFKKSSEKTSARTLGKTLARELTSSEQAVIAGGTCFHTWPPINNDGCDPHAH